MNILSFSIPKKLKKLIFKISIIQQNLDINNLRNTSSKYVDIKTTRKLIEYYLKSVGIKAMFTITVFEILLLQNRSILLSTQWATASERVN